MDVDDSINKDYYNKMLEAITEADADIACSGMVNEPKPHRTMLFKKRKILKTTEDKLKITNVGKWGFSVRYLFKTDFLKKSSQATHVHVCCCCSNIVCYILEAT